MCRDARQEDLATFEVDEEQHVEPAQCDGIHGEEVTRQRPGRLSSEELRPRRAGSARWLTKTVTTQDVPHACGRDGDAELGALSDDAEIAPARLLPPEAQDESDLKGPNSRTRPIVARGSSGVTNINRRSRMGTRHRSAPDRDTGSRSHAVAVVVVGGTAEGGCLSSGSTLVLVDDAAEDIATNDLACRVHLFD